MSRLSVNQTTTYSPRCDEKARTDFFRCGSDGDGMEVDNDNFDNDDDDDNSTNDNHLRAEESEDGMDNDINGKSFKGAL